MQLDEIFQQIKASDDHDHVAEIVQCRSFCHGSAPLHAFAGRSENRITGQSARTRSRRPPLFSIFINQTENLRNFHPDKVYPLQVTESSQKQNLTRFLLSTSRHYDKTVRDNINKPVHIEQFRFKQVSVRRLRSSQYRLFDVHAVFFENAIFDAHIAAPRLWHR